MTRDNNFPCRGRSRSNGRRTFNSVSRASSIGPQFGQYQQKSRRGIKCYNCRSCVTSRMTAAIAWAIVTVKVKGALETGGSTDLKAVLIRTLNTGCRPSVPYLNKRSSKKKVRYRKPRGTQLTSSPLQMSTYQTIRRPFIKIGSCWRYLESSMAFSALVC